jgi:nitrous oxidase accessory protein NosD
MDREGASMTRPLHLLLAVLTLILPLAARATTATTIHVPSHAFPTIQSAVDHAVAAATPFTIIVKKGTYLESVRIDSAFGLSLRGSGEVILDAGDGNRDIIITNGNFVELRGLTVVDFASAGILVQGSADTHIHKCTIGVAETTTLGDGIRVENDARVFIEKNTIQAVLDGIRLDQADHASIEKNVIKDASGDASIRLFHANAMPPDGGATNSSVFGNRIRGNLLGVTTAGILIGGTDNVVEKNEVVGEGIGMESAPDATRTIFRRNKLKVLAFGDAIVVGGASNFVLRNILESSPGHSGIHVLASADAASISQNKITAPDIGILVDGNGCVTDHNKIIEPDLHGVQTNATGGFFSHDVVTRCGNDAFEIKGSGNHFDGCKAISSGDDGFDVDGNGNTIDNSRSIHAVGDGFLVFGTGNQFTGCAASDSGGLDLFDGPTDAGTPPTNTYTNCNFGTSNLPE